MQVGSLCYADAVSAGAAACAAHLPVTSLVTGSTIKVVTLSCTGVDSAGKLQMQTSVVTPGNVAQSASGIWQIVSSASGSDVGYSGSFGSDFCTARNANLASIGRSGTCTQTGCTANSANDAEQYVWQWQGCTEAAIAPVVSTVGVAPAFGPCQWEGYVQAVEVIVGAALLAWIGWYGIKKVNDQIKWGRGDAS